MNHSPRHRRLRAGLLLLAAVAGTGVAGCSIFASKKPVTIYAAEPALPVARAAAPVAWRLSVAQPRANRQLSSPRILVSPAPGIIEVYPLAQWSDPAPDLIGDLLLETLESSGRILGLDRAISGLDADYQLGTELRDFQLEVQPAPPHAVISLYARLRSTSENRIVAGHLFQARIPASSTNITAAVAAFNEALTSMLPAVADWTMQEAQQNWQNSAPAH